MDDAEVFFTSGGAEAIETAAKLARRLLEPLGPAGASTVDHLARARLPRHGRASARASRARTSSAPGSGRSSPDAPQVAVGLGRRAARRDRGGRRRARGGLLLRAGDRRRRRARAAAGLPRTRCAQICRDAGVLLRRRRGDRGYGRVRRLVREQRFGLEPDLVDVRQGLTSGYLPLGGVIVGQRIAEPFWQPGDGGMFRHGYTYSGHAAVAAARTRQPRHPRARAASSPAALELESELTDGARAARRPPARGRGPLGRRASSPPSSSTRPIAATDARRPRLAARVGSTASSPATSSAARSRSRRRS